MQRQLTQSDHLHSHYSQPFLERTVLTHTFAAQFCFAVQTTFITALLVEYSMESTIDSFIWIIPNILLIILKPYYSHYLQSAKNTTNSHINNSLASLLISAAGIIVIIISTFPQFFIHAKYWWLYHFIRIIFSAIGWTFMDVGLAFVIANRDALTDIIQKPNIGEEIVKTEYAAKILAFGLSFHACAKSPSWNNFHKIVDTLYLTAFFICTSVFLLTLFSRNISETIKSLNPLSYFRSIIRSAKQIPIKKQTFFPGAIHIQTAPLQIKSHLITKFCLGYIIDVIMIYSCMWFVWAVGEHQEELTSSILITGLRFGSFFLLLFALNEYVLSKWLERFSVPELQMVILLTVVFNLIFNVLAFFNMHIIYLSLVVLSGSALKSTYGVYFSKVQNSLSELFEHNDSCTDFVETVQGLFTLSVMPFFWMIVMNDDDTNKCLVGSIIGLVIVLVTEVERWGSPKEKIE